MLASAAIVADVIDIAARAPIADLVGGIMIAFAQPVRLSDCINLVLPLRADVEAISAAMLEAGEQLAPAPEGKQDAVEVVDIGSNGVRLRLHAWAADSLRRRELASDLRAAVLRRPISDGLIGGRHGDGDD